MPQVPPRGLILRTQAGAPAVTVPEAARRLGITPAAAYLAIQERRLHAAIETVQATRVLVPLTALRAYRRSGQVKGRPRR